MQLVNKQRPKHSYANQHAEVEVAKNYFGFSTCNFSLCWIPFTVVANLVGTLLELVTGPSSGSSRFGAG